MKPFDLHIDRIVVDGLPPAAKRQFSDALEKGLRDLAEAGIANELAGRSGLSIQSLDAGRLPPGATPAQAAMRIVHAIRQSILGAGSVSLPGTSLRPVAGAGGKHV
jgi:hypothetical protein